MTRPTVVSAILLVIVAALLVWHFRSNWRYHAPPEMTTRRRRYVTGWEVRGLVLVIFVPFAAAMVFGYVSRDYLLSLILFLMAGLLLADLIAPSGLTPRG